MPTKRLKPITGILKTATPFKNINKQLNDLSLLDAAIKTYLPAEITPHINVSNIGKEGRLTITSNTSAWASQLRFHLPRLLEKLYEDGHQIHEISLRVSPAWIRPNA